MKKKPGMFWIPVLLGAALAMPQVPRPNALWFNKVISLERSRQLYVALHADMWVMYDLPQAVLFQAWQGGAEGGAFVSGAPAAATPQYWFFTGAPQFPHVWRPSGASYFKDSVAEYFASYADPAHVNAASYHAPGKWPRQPLGKAWGGAYKSWSVRDADGRDVNVTVRFRGYRVSSLNVITLMFGLVLPDDGGEISVTESPEYSGGLSERRLVRTFTFANVPAGHTVRLEKMGGDVPSAWSVTSGAATVQGAALVQTGDGRTVLAGSFRGTP